MLNVAILVYNFLIIAGASFLVAVYQWSLWTYVFAVLLMVWVEHNGNEKK